MRKITLAYFLILTSTLSLPAIPCAQVTRQTHARRITHSEYGEAMAWSIGATTLMGLGGVGIAKAGYPSTGFLLAFSGFVIGPSIGQFRLGYIGHGLSATALRTGGAMVTTVALVMSLLDRCVDCQPQQEHGFQTIFITGLGLYGAGLAYSVIQPIFQIGRPKSSTASSWQVQPILALEPAPFLKTPNRDDAIKVKAYDIAPATRLGLMASLGF